MYTVVINIQPAQGIMPIELYDSKTHSVAVIDTLIDGILPTLQALDCR